MWAGRVTCHSQTTEKKSFLFLIFTKYIIHFFEREMIEETYYVICQRMSQLEKQALLMKSSVCSKPTWLKILWQNKNNLCIAFDFHGCFSSASIEGNFENYLTYLSCVSWKKNDKSYSKPKSCEPYLHNYIYKEQEVPDASATLD